MWKKMTEMENRLKNVLKALSDRNATFNEYVNRSSLQLEINETRKILSESLKKQIKDEIRILKKGYAAGGFYSKSNGANTLCLPKDPNWRKYQDSVESYTGTIYGAEYETRSYTVGELLHQDHKEFEVPCAVCQSLKYSQVYMLPAKDRCYNGWHLEYRGYLMSQAEVEQASMFLCVDAQPDVIGSKANHNGRTFYPVEARCGSLKCPPYVNGRELTCAVCKS